MDDAIHRGKAYSDAYNNTIIIYLVSIMAIREFSLAIHIINTIVSFVSKVSSIDHERCYIGSLAILIITR